MGVGAPVGVAALVGVVAPVGVAALVNWIAIVRVIDAVPIRTMSLVSMGTIARFVYVR